MMKPWRPLALAAVFNVTVFVGVVTAQTVIVRNAPVGATVELVLNTDTIGSATADASGIASLALNLAEKASKTEIDASIYVDICGDTMRRVVVVERGRQPVVSDSGCERRQIIGLFLVRRVSTLVVDIGGPNPTVLLRQGSVSLKAKKIWAAPTGLVVFGGGSFGKFSNARLAPCGNVNCSADDVGLGYTAGAEYWISPFLAGEATYLRAPKATASGSGSTFNFNSSLEIDVFTAAGKVGIPVGRARLFGKVGATYQKSAFRTTETISDLTITVDGVSQTITGGTQSFELKTAGWGWFFGGGAEFWVAPAFAIYGEGGRATLKGEALDNEEGILDERLTYVLFGGRVRIGW